MHAHHDALDAGRHAAHHRTWFFALAGTAIAAWALAGFWPQYYGRLLSGEALSPRVNSWGVHVHSSIFALWLLGFVLQATLARLGRARWHWNAGMALAVFGLTSAIGGTLAGFAVIVARVEGGLSQDHAATLVFFVLNDIGMFAGFLIAALVWRHSREAHPRLMWLATLSLAFVGMGRLISQVEPTLWVERRWAAMLIVLTPLFAAMAHDLLRRRAIHPVYLVGLVLFVLRLLRLPLATSDLWRSVGRGLLRPFL